MLQTVLNARYQITKELGYGGFGTTYLAKDSQTNNSWCAIKKLNPAHADIQTAQKLFKREADTLLRLQAVHQVPKFIDYFEENNHFYIVEEYIEGDSLDSLLSHQWNVQSIVIFLWEILSILQLLHDKNIVHRDIKPSNLIQRKKDNKFTIIDFGAVKEIDLNQPEKIGTRIYHQGYTPIEQIEGRPQLNSDIYALGVTAIQLLTKEPPREFIRDENDYVLDPQARLAPLWLVNILNKMVRTDFHERYQSVEEVLKDLGQRNNRSEPREDSINNRQKLVTTDLVNNHEQTETENKTVVPNNYRNKLLYLPLIVIALLLIGSEVIKPWIRPWYYLHQGNSLLDKNQAQDSLNKFQQVINLQRDSAAAWKGRGDALFTLGRYSGALEAYEKAIAVEPDNVKVLNNKGKILYKQGEFKKAIETHQQAIKIDPNNADAWSSKGLAYMSLQQYEQALKSFDQAQNIKPEDPTIWLQKGIVLRSLQRPQEAKIFYQEALDVYEEITAKNNKNPSSWTDRGFVLLQLNRPEEAFASYDQALMLDSNFYEALLGKANVLGILQDYEQAKQILDQAKEIRPKDYQVWYNRGNLLLQALNNPEEALASFKQATQLKADFYPAWLGQGLSLSALQRYNDALLALDKAKDLNPQDPFVWMNRGVVLEELGELETAFKSYQKAATELNFAPAKEHLDRLKQKLGL
jgi:serine/threonine protein kinase